MPKIDGDQVKDAMARRRMKRSDLAAATRVPPRTLTNALGANRHPIDRSKIQAICDVLGLDPDDVVLSKRPEPSRPPDKRPAKDEPRMPNPPTRRRFDDREAVAS